ncbi:hypothetical protein N7491_010436 [Penicillium cf. griseofulvum]|uniref:RTA1 like protein n=1 Tax=Penicillium cf. griseofulvum TaxID=2972120 RepID=A0A9W9N086_9EURO|nr:hypothetical protein N7472_000769 [Penicillium cf. griseofulvum]KAJ5421991.1 hypothetical protein N7491_010436 [Penicillium cf. griseofulvum]
MVFHLYHYDPSLAAAAIFIILFTASTGLHFFQMAKTRTWFFIAFCCGGIFEIIGYIGRTTPGTLGAYIVQSIFLLIAPALFAASIYMELGRIVDLVDGDHYLLLRRGWLTRIFVTGDVLSFFMQGGGGGLMGSDIADDRDTGSYLIVGGLFVQIVFFGCFIATALLFHVRIHRKPTQKVLTNRPPFLRHIVALYTTSLLIFVRSIVRVVEFIQGFDGFVISHEVFIYLFDAVLMLAVMLIMNWVHPSEVKTHLTGGRMSKGFLLIDYPDVA